MVVKGKQSRFTGKRVKPEPKEPKQPKGAKVTKTVVKGKKGAVAKARGKQAAQAVAVNVVIHKPTRQPRKTKAEVAAAKLEHQKPPEKPSQPAIITVAPQIAPQIHVPHSAGIGAVQPQYAHRLEHPYRVERDAYGNVIAANMLSPPLKPAESSAKPVLQPSETTTTTIVAEKKPLQHSLTNIMEIPENDAVRSHFVPNRVPSGSLQEYGVVEDEKARRYSPVEMTAAPHRLQTAVTNYTSLYRDNRPEIDEQKLQQQKQETFYNLMRQFQAQYKPPAPRPVEIHPDYAGVKREELRTKFNEVFHMGHASREGGFNADYLRTTLSRWRQEQASNPHLDPDQWIRNNLPQPGMATPQKTPKKKH